METLRSAGRDGRRLQASRNGRLLTALRQWSLFYRLTRYSRFVSFRKLLLEPVLSESVIDAGYRLRHRGKAPYLDYSPIRADHASRMNVSFRAQEAGHSFHGRLQIDDRLRWLKSGDYLAEWRAGEKALHGVEARDPTADPEVVNFCLGVPPEQFLAEDIDQSLIWRAMWGVSPDSVLTNRLVGFQSADWYEKFEPRKQAFLDYLTAQQGSPSVACAIDLERLQRIIREWPQDDRQKQAEALKNHLPLSRGLAAARFLNWIDSQNGAGPN